MARVVVLDSGPLGLLTRARGIPQADDCRAWLAALATAGARAVVPEVADYEVRRELLRVGAPAALQRLDRIVAAATYAPITTPAMRRAAEFWALVRQAGRPTAAPAALDADCIVAAQASPPGGPGDAVVIATRNVGHMARFPGVAAEEWDRISP